MFREVVVNTSLSNVIEDWRHLFDGPGGDSEEEASPIEPSKFPLVLDFNLVEWGKHGQSGNTVEDGAIVVEINALTEHHERQYVFCRHPSSESD